MRIRCWAVIVCVVALLALPGCRGKRPGDQSPQPASPGRSGAAAQNLILMVANGMGHTHVAAARAATLSSGQRLHMERLPVSGSLTTSNALGEIPDTAAAATALACGIKTLDGVIAQTQDFEDAQTLALAALRAGKQVGLVTSGGLTAPLAAAFLAHASGPGRDEAILQQVLHSGAEVLMGGRTPAFQAAAENLQDALRKFTLVTDTSELDALTDGDKPVLGLFGETGIPYDLERPESVPPLSKMVEWAIQILQNSPNGFVLIILADRLDDACRALDPTNVIGELVAFDAAVQVSTAFCDENPDTLLIVTSTCESGGLALRGPTSLPAVTNNVTRFGNPLSVEFGAVLETEDGQRFGMHTGADVPLFADGPGAEQLAGLLDNTDLPRIAGRILGLDLASLHPALSTP